MRTKRSRRHSGTSRSVLGSVGRSTFALVLTHTFGDVPDCPKVRRRQITSRPKENIATKGVTAQTLKHVAMVAVPPQWQTGGPVNNQQQQTNMNENTYIIIF